MSPVYVRAHVDRTEGNAILRFPYDPPTIATLKQWPGCRWNPGIKAWVAPLNLLPILQRNLAMGIVMQEERRAAIPEVFAARLRPYQMDGADFLIRNTGALLTMDPRTGKTPTAIAAACALLGSKQADALVCVYPASVRGEWERQLKSWAELELHPLETYDPLEPHEVDTLRSRAFLAIGCHYEILAQRADCLHRVLDGRRYVLVADELHHCKNRKIDRTKALWSLAHAEGSVAPGFIGGECVARWGLSGTPMRNRPKDLWALFEFCYPDAGGKYWSFAKRYCDAHQDERGHWDDFGVSEEEELAERLTAISYRKTRIEVAEWLPKSDRSVIFCAVADKEMKKYRKLERHYATAARAELESGDGEEALRRLVAATSVAKIPTAVARAYQHAARGVKVIVFAHFHETLKGLDEAFDKKAEPYAPTDSQGEMGMDARSSVGGGDNNGLPPHFTAGGWMDPGKRRKVIEQWRATPGPSILLANSLSSGVGIDLADAEVAIFLELEWVPSDFRQAEDRIQDVHQGKRKTPPIYEYLLVQHTVDEAMATAMLRKVRAAEAIVGHDVEAADVASKLRGSGVVGSSGLMLENTSKEVVDAALDSLRAKLMAEEDPEETGETLAGAFADDWDDDEANPDKGTGEDVAF